MKKINPDIYVLTKEQLEFLADLKMQAMLLDMDVDIEALTLTEKSDYKEPFWLTNWKEKEHGSDFDTRFNVDFE